MIVTLRSKSRRARVERVQLLQKVQHAIPVLVLLPAGLQALREGAHGVALALAVFEIVISLLLVGALIRAVRGLRRAHAAAPQAHHGVDWIDILIAGVLFAEVAEHYHLTHHVKRPTLLLAFAMLAIGVLHGRIFARVSRRYTLRVEDEGLYVGGKPFRTLRATWEELDAIEIGERYATIRLKDGRTRRLDLPDLEEPDQVRAALASAQQRTQAVVSALKH